MRSRSLPVSVRAGVWASFLILAGLLLMHGIGSHGTMGDDHDGMAPMAMASTAAAAPAGLVTTLQPVIPPGSDEMSSMCVVVLTLALVVGLWLSGLARVPRDAAALRRLRPVAGRARAPDPPCLVKLSVCRC